jgi:hypothetical protein
MLLGAAEVSYSNSKKIEMTEKLTVLTAIADGPVNVDWDHNSPLEIGVEDLEQEPETSVGFSEVPGATSKARNFDTWKKDFAGWIYRNQRLELFESPTLELVSNPGEEERDFRVRLQQLAREQRDEAVEKLRQKYAPKIATLEDRKRRAEQTVAREEEQSKSSKLQTAISFGATLLGSFMGRKAVSMSTLGRATTAVRGVGRSMKESQDVGRAQENVAAVDEKIQELNDEFNEETAKLESKFDPQNETLEKVSLKPTKANIAVKLVTLAWAPYNSDGSPAW